MTTRTELIARLHDSYVPGVNEDLRMAADILEADAINDDLTIAYMSGFKAGEDKYKAAARLALDALTDTPDDPVDYIDEAIAALEEVLK